MFSFIYLFTKKKKIYKNKHSGVLFEEIIDFGNESVMLRLDVGVRLLIPKIELEKYYEKVQ